MQHWFHNLKGLLWGDWLVLALCILLVACLWRQGGKVLQAHTFEVRRGQHVVGVYDLNQERHLSIRGAIGTSDIHVHAGKVRFAHAPCHNQYCVQQGWLSHAGQVALCLPNQVSIVLLGEPGFDSLSY